MTTIQTYRKSIIGNISAIKIAEDSLSSNLQLAGIYYSNGHGDKTTVYADKTGVTLSSYLGPQGHEASGFTSVKTFTWGDLAKRIDFKSSPRAMKLKTGKAFHRIASLGYNNELNTYCGEGWKSERYEVNTVKEFEKQGFGECRNCVRTKKRIDIAKGRK